MSSLGAEFALLSAETEGSGRDDCLIAFATLHERLRVAQVASYETGVTVDDCSASLAPGSYLSTVVFRVSRFGISLALRSPSRSTCLNRLVLLNSMSSSANQNSRPGQWSVLVDMVDPGDINVKPSLQTAIYKAS